MEACIAAGDVGEARRLYVELAGSGAPTAVQAEALAALAAAHGVRHEPGVAVGGIPNQSKLHAAIWELHLPNHLSSQASRHRTGRLAGAGLQGAQRIKS